MKQENERKNITGKSTIKDKHDENNAIKEDI